MSKPAFTPERYLRPSGRGDAVANRVVRWLTRHGVSLWGSRILQVPGRRSGALQQVPVNLLVLDGRRFLVSPRGNTQWVRNVRAAGGATLRVGRRTEDVALVELPVEHRVPVLRAYVSRWAWEVGRLLDGLSARSTDAELLAAAPGVPAFEVKSPDAAGARPAA